MQAIRALKLTLSLELDINNVILCAVQQCKIICSVMLLNYAKHSTLSYSPAFSDSKNNPVGVQFRLSLHKLDTRGILPVSHRLLEERLVLGAELVINLVGNDTVWPDPLQPRCGGPPTSGLGRGRGRAGDPTARAGGGRGAGVTAAAVGDVVTASVMAASSVPVGEKDDVRGGGQSSWETMLLG